MLNKQTPHLIFTLQFSKAKCFDNRTSQEKKAKARKCEEPFPLIAFCIGLV